MGSSKPNKNAEQRAAQVRRGIENKIKGVLKQKVGDSYRLHLKSGWSIGKENCPMENEPTLFTVYRKHDESGISGVGRVMDGVIFHTGQVAVAWRTDPSSINIFRSFEEFRDIHIDRHPDNETRIEWLR